MLKKTICFLFVFFLIISIYKACYAKYIIEDTKVVADINIDGKKPKIEIINVSNTNEKHNKYANKTHIITINLRVEEKNIKENNLENNIEFLLGDTKINQINWKTNKKIIEGDYIYYNISVTNIKGNGMLKIKIPQDTVIDKANQGNDEYIYNTQILIDNIAPVASFYQEEIEDGKVLAKIKANEKIDKVNAWNINNDNTILSKEFECNVLYPFKITDYAQNSSQIDIKIDKATKIKIRYGGTATAWEFGTGLNEIAGRKTIEGNKILKTEAMSFYWEGLAKDFIQVKNYIHTYWGEGTKGICYTYETYYNSGYNPNKNTYSSLANGTLINLDGNITLLMGGVAMNRAGNRGIGGKAIPEDIAKKYPFGISALNIKLKDTSYYSIVYQIWVNGKGWLTPVSDGEETTYNHETPMGAYRMSLIPKTEKNYLLELWEKDVGTNNVK